MFYTIFVFLCGVYIGQEFSIPKLNPLIEFFTISHKNIKEKSLKKKKYIIC